MWLSLTAVGFFLLIILLLVDSKTPLHITTWKVGFGIGMVIMLVGVSLHFGFKYRGKFDAKFPNDAEVVVRYRVANHGLHPVDTTIVLPVIKEISYD